MAETTKSAPSSASRRRTCADRHLCIPLAVEPIRQTLDDIEAGCIVGQRGRCVEPQSFFERIRAERVFSPNWALPAPVTTILVGRVISFYFTAGGMPRMGNRRRFRIVDLRIWVDQDAGRGKLLALQPLNEAHADGLRSKSAGSDCPSTALLFSHLLSFPTAGPLAAGPT